MYKNLIEDAKQEGIKEMVVDAIIHKDNGEILLIENLGDVKPIYGFPSAELKKKETIPQALQRAITEKTAMQLKEVIAYIGHYDKDGVRHFHFVAEVSDPYSLEENTNIAYAWLNTDDAVGYPITDEVRGMLDLYKRLEP